MNKQLALPPDLKPDDPAFMALLNDRLRRLAAVSDSTNLRAIQTTHPLRTKYRASDYPEGTILTESDRSITFAARPDGWYYVAGKMTDYFARRPSDLTTRDAGFLFLAQDKGITWRWDGAKWQYESGEWRDTLANKPTLTTQDAGIYFYATDYRRRFRWTGSAWERAPGELPTLATVETPVDPGAGWHACDGSIGVTYTKDNATTDSITWPDETGAYRKADVWTGTVNAAATGTMTGQTGDALTDASIDATATSKTAAAGAAVGLVDPQHHHAPGTLKVTGAEPMNIAIPRYFRL